MGKATCNPEKLRNAVRFLQKSRTCWNLKDLEKQLVSVCSINGMQVKDYLQHLSDENLIKVEKIGSGNWYWSFASENRIAKETALAAAQKEHAKISGVVTELQHKLASTAAALEEEADGQDHSGESREELNAGKVVLEDEVRSLKKELESFAEDDPTELERKKQESKKCMQEAEQATDDIQSMEMFFKKVHPEVVTQMPMAYEYGDEWDLEEYCFKDL
ncbi:Meiotic coiled-coil protein 7 [Fulvia fulva]|uniref:Meiotic coiled-coil protein 7 n=1 Tax=Passalora fulva TaxID=5499 RepID=A0A9Q8PIR5_PASFU|nr:Meiotic coiled-coil protein 7 [Fulvia fulva]KAK4615461.1 Meiotic coiled-coil protein 7 [Fulvia fulva]KAK4617260.1 Meiotic coiled-coil protein 7 [Fulvia fulva]UJO23176.1 Meiotic coiled-coil protein 7 [Fulvia fulva]WPV18982.1 Meiotic coiled-coil protein 7 [Fulvia fulva]WPV33678.1 Meiotic coiled-coil protein 7 [Fulvia fulva]